jgi:hypothetical protein
MKYTRNCGDLVRASQKLLVIGCKNNGAISIYRKKKLKITLQHPLVERFGKYSRIPSVTGLNIGFVETIYNKNLS